MFKIYTVNEAAERLHITPRTLRRYMAGGRISYVKLDNRVLFREFDINIFLEEHVVNERPWHVQPKDDRGR